MDLSASAADAQPRPALACWTEAVVKRLRLSEREMLLLVDQAHEALRFPADAAPSLRNRADLPEIVADLVPFMGEPGIDALLAEKATVADWVRALRVFDGPAQYWLSVQWSKSNAAAPPSAVDAATALLWEKNLGDFRFRAAFAAPRRDCSDRILFERSGAIVMRTSSSLVKLPYSALRVLAAREALAEQACTIVIASFRRVTYSGCSRRHE